MKEFDIEKLNRKNIFKTPDGFFEEMQNKVLQETKTASRGSIVNLKWVYGAAAAVALLFGITFFINLNSASETQLVSQIASPQHDVVTETLSVDKPYTEETVALRTLESDLTSVEKFYPKKHIEDQSFSTAGDITVTRKATSNPEVQVDQILATFTSVELADVGKNTEQDIYLDLYN